MNWIFLSFVYGLALAMDCLALSITDGLVYEKMEKGKQLFIAGVFALGQGLFPLIGYLLGVAFSEWIDQYDHWIGFALLLIIGGKMVYEGIKGTIHPEVKDSCEVTGSCKKFSYGEVLLQGVADSIDALAVGITITANIGLVGVEVTYQPYVAFLIIALVTFVVSMIGLMAGKGINKLLKGKYEICEVIGGVVLIVLGCLILFSGLGWINL
ncbi:MAG: manganese efflux pump MntP family protein [Bacilli bacterium]|jgi:putative Mn2+ efflux pump MntP|nr:manganese efflux pump MntP family protein [Bacilli bacterium]MCH4228896.1 manganese efflux pump MntP family protein [Bacilli bacterium]